jgi:hypothetical protein
MRGHSTPQLTSLEQAPARTCLDRARFALTVEQVNRPFECAEGLDQSLTEPEIDRWLVRLGASDGGPLAERLLVLHAIGEPLMERRGERSTVQIDPDLDTLLRQPGMNVVLVHNHPDSLGLSDRDFMHLAKAGMAAVVANQLQPTFNMGSQGVCVAENDFRSQPLVSAMRLVFVPAMRSASSVGAGHEPESRRCTEDPYGSLHHDGESLARWEPILSSHRRRAGGRRSP